MRMNAFIYFENINTAMVISAHNFSPFVHMQWSSLTFTVKGEKEQEQAGDQVPQEGDHTTGDAFRDWVHSLNEELEEYWHAAVDENANQDAGSVQDGCGKGKGKSRTTISRSITETFDVIGHRTPSEQLFKFKILH